MSEARTECVHAFRVGPHHDMFPNPRLHCATCAAEARHIIHMPNGLFAVSRPIWMLRPKSIFGLPTISPTCTFTMCWSAFLLLVDLLFVGFWVPLSLAFCAHEQSLEHRDVACVAVDSFGGIAYIANLLLAFQTGVVLTHGQLGLQSVAHRCGKGLAEVTGIPDGRGPHTQPAGPAECGTQVWRGAGDAAGGYQSGEREALDTELR